MGENIQFVEYKRCDESKLENFGDTPKFTHDFSSPS